MPDHPGWNPESSLLMQTMGFVRLVSTDPEVGRACVEFEAKQHQCHSGNVVQGGFVTGWIDNAMATAAMLKTNFERDVMSLEVKISFYRAANPGIVVAEGWIERIGKRTAFAEGQLRTQDGEIIAKGTSTIALLAPRR
jgi:acyl-CoA thioesterase